ncbi:MAG: ATP-binding protein, partial [Saprospiraceae bacterium]
DIVSFTGYIIDSLRGQALQKQIHFHFLCNEEQIMMDYDPDKYTIILSNLVSNAIKFSPDNSNVYISLTQLKKNEKDQIEISVKDQGIGMNSEELNHIFERFYQVDNAISASGIGTGVGLSLVKELVQLFEGDIQVVSTSGKGTQFKVTLPVHTTSSLETKIYTPQLQSHQAVIPEADISNSDDIIDEQKDKPEILIIEDNMDVLKYLRICLGDLYTLIISKDGGDGIEKAIRTVPHLVLSDVMMPVKDGLTVCRELKHNPVTSHIPVILLSAKADAASRIAGLESGADVYITKPFEKDELRAQIQNLLDRFKDFHLRYANPESIPTEVKNESQEVEDEFLTRVRNLVHAHLDDNEFSVNDLERGVFLSRSQLHKKLKALTGLSAMQFVSRIRLNVAREKLKEDHGTISDIAYQVGYSDPNYFSRAYADEFMETPSETRKKFINK